MTKPGLQQRIPQETLKSLALTAVFGIVSWAILTWLAGIVMTNGIGQGWRSVFALGAAWGIFMGSQLPSLAETIARDYGGSYGIREAER